MSQRPVPIRERKGFGAASWVFTSVVMLIVVASAIDMCLKRFASTNATAMQVCGYVEKYFLKYVYSPLAIAPKLNVDFTSFIRLFIGGLSLIFATVQLARYPDSAFAKCAFAFSFIFALALVICKYVLVDRYIGLL